MRLAALALLMGLAIGPGPIAAPSAALAQTSPSPAGPRSDRLGLNGLRLGLFPSAVRAQLGRPQRMRSQPPGNYRRYEIWDYPNLTVGFGDGQVVALATTRPRWATPDGVVVGDRADRIPAVYGKPHWHDGDRLGYSTDDGAYLTFRVTGDRITEILCGWLPD